MVVQAWSPAGIGVDAVIPAREQGLEDYFLGLTQSSDVDSGGAHRRRRKAVRDDAAARASSPSCVRQKRSYVGWVGLLAVPVLITLALYLNRNNRHHDNGPGGVDQPGAATTACSCRSPPIAMLLGLPAALAGRDGRAAISSPARPRPAPSRPGSCTPSAAAACSLEVGRRPSSTSSSAWRWWPPAAASAGGLAFGLHAPALLSRPDGERRLTVCG